ncbi:MAG TPA: hypothetical protein VE093_31280 [Polyangiaceae bacterium]|jgi:hypothetical protein|nr:hypothetical protein [Polyangiaceae bacterium]
MSIKGAEGMTVGELARELDQGAKIVVFEWCISLLVITLKRASDPYLIRPGQSAAVKSLPWTLLSLVVGWWGLPWGLIYTPWTVVVNLRGGRDVTYDVRQRLPRA